MTTLKGAGSKGALPPSHPPEVDAKRRWLEEVYGPAITRRPERKRRFSTLSDELIEPLYTADDLAGFDPARDPGFPGEVPYTRGVQAPLYPGRPWPWRRLPGSAPPEEGTGRSPTLRCRAVGGL